MVTPRRVLLAFFAFVALAAATSLTTPVVAAQDKQMQCIGRYNECVVATWDTESCAKEYKGCMATSLQDTGCASRCLTKRLECRRTGSESECFSAYNRCTGSCHAFASEVAVVFNCAWARAEMQRCATAYASTHSDDEYEACIRVPSATIENDPKCAFPEAAVEVEAVTPVTGMRECVKECKSKGKDAANKCKHEKFAKRAQCYAQVPTSVKACESGCTRKPRAYLKGGSCDACIDQGRACSSSCNSIECDEACTYQNKMCWMQCGGNGTLE